MTAAAAVRNLSLRRSFPVPLYRKRRLRILTIVRARRLKASPLPHAAVEICLTRHHLQVFTRKEMPLADNSKVDRANAQFNKLQRAEDGKKAMSEYEADRIALRTKTERLKAARLARDAAEKAAAPMSRRPRRRNPPRRKRPPPRPSQGGWTNSKTAAGAAEA